MRVLHVDTGMEWRGGQRQVLLLALGLREAGTESELAAPGGSPLAQRAARAGLVVHDFNARGDLDVAAALRLVRLVRAHERDVIHAHDARAHALARLAGLRLRGVRLVVSRRTAFGGTRGVFSRLKYRGVDRYIAVSEAAGAQLAALGVDTSRIAVVYDGVEPPGVPPAPEDWRARYGMRHDAPVIGCLGALTAEKGHEDAVAAIARLGDPAAHLVLVGDGPRAAALAALAASQGLAGRVHLAGFHETPRAAIAGFDIYVQPSRAEGLGSSLLDALLLGKPAVATTAGGLPEIIGASGAGLLVPPDDPAALAAALRRLLADRPLRESLACAARERAGAFTAEAMAAATHAVYRELLEPR